MRSSTPDGTFRAFSRNLIAALEAAGCNPVTRHENGDASFHRTDTVKRVIEEYVASSRVAKRATRRQQQQHEQREAA
jgi:hypothetical protein